MHDWNDWNPPPPDEKKTARRIYRATDRPYRNAPNDEPSNRTGGRIWGSVCFSRVSCCTTDGKDESGRRARLQPAASETAPESKQARNEVQHLSNMDAAKARRLRMKLPGGSSPFSSSLVGCSKKHCATKHDRSPNADQLVAISNRVAAVCWLTMRKIMFGGGNQTPNHIQLNFPDASKEGGEGKKGRHK
ncbi:hypothetical protein ZHAS_00004050 [Anopheles sinensis]|uniref:Uncharacterized protein n=1 Tax=Anopheles sinensis TaxID=74873 RepID=A0A084VFX9_ANOSI|nr:hypothetical protein ZHAS_00004050 [Anopheles sinensis]